MGEYRSHRTVDPAALKGQPHDGERAQSQPYAAEHEDYAHGPVKPPDQQAERQADRPAKSRPRRSRAQSHPSPRG
jgi:hypothetical protein